MNAELENILFVGFNGRVAALNRKAGGLLWQWRCPKVRIREGYVSLLLDNMDLFVAVDGYIYCLDARTGEQLWQNEMKGFGTGVTSLVTVNANARGNHQVVAAASARHQQSTTSAGTP